MGAHKTLHYRCLLWEEYAGDFNIWVSNLGVPIESVPLDLEDGRSIPVGALVTRLGGTKTSAGYPTIHMLDGCHLEYMGQASSMDGTLALFRQASIPDFYVAYYVFREFKTLFFHTPQVAGRVVHTTRCEWTVPAEVSDAG